jgi:hypothetical protein
MSAVVGHSWPQLRPYAVSLTRTGFNGTKLMFVCDIAPDTRANLVNMGFKLVDFSTDRSKFVVQGRFAPAVEFLKENHKEFRRVVWTDARDVVFQTDPALWLEAHLKPHRLLGARECWLIKNEGFNNKWAKETVNADAYEWLCEQEACCGGTLAGDSEMVFMALSEVYRIVSGSSVANDQAALNYILRIPPFKEATRIPKLEEGFAVMCAAFHSDTFSSYIDASIPLTDSVPLFDKATGMIFTPDAHVPFSIVHQYDRDLSWKTIIEEKYQ